MPDFFEDPWSNAAIQWWPMWLSFMEWYECLRENHIDVSMVLVHRDLTNARCEWDDTMGTHMYLVERMW